MPAGASWSWIEAYGQVAAGGLVHSDNWSVARKAAASAIDVLAPADMLADALQQADGWTRQAPSVRLHAGSGWGALEQQRRSVVGEPPIQLPGSPFDADTMTAEQEPWLRLLADHGLPPSGAEPPISYVVGSSWRRLLEGCADSPTAWLHRGVARWADGLVNDARTAWQRAGDTPWALRNIAVADIVTGDHQAGAQRLRRAHEAAPDCRALTLETMQALRACGSSADALAVVDGLATTPDARLRLEEAWAALETGDLDRTSRLLDAKLIPADLREGESCLTDLWFAYQEAVLEQAGGQKLTDDQRAELRHTHPIPAWYDFVTS